MSTIKMYLKYTNKIAKIGGLIVLGLQLSSCVLPIQSLKREPVDNKIIRQLFYDYKFSLLNDLGRKAADLLSHETLDYYERLKQLALTARHKRLNTLPPFNKLIVIAIRHHISLDVLRNISAKELFAYGVREKWISKYNIAPYEIGKIAVYGHYASAELMHKNKDTDILLEFNKRQGVWKLNLVPILQHSIVNFSKNLQVQNIDEDRLIIAIVESMSGRRVSDTIWSPYNILRQKQSGRDQKGAMKQSTQPLTSINR